MNMLLSSASPCDVEAPNLNGAILVKGQNGLCSKLQISLDELPIALVRRIESQYPNFSQLSIFEQLEPASRQKVFIRRFLYAWFLCVLGAVVFTFTYAAVSLGASGGSIDGVLIFAITLWIGTVIAGIIGICCFSQRFNVLVERGMEDTCEFLNNMKGVAFQCKKSKKEVVTQSSDSSNESTQESIYIEGMCLSSLCYASYLEIWF